MCNDSIKYCELGKCRRFGVQIKVGNRYPTLRHCNEED